MRNLWRLLKVLTGQRFRDYLMAEANDLHGRAIALAGWIIGAAVFAILLNLFGAKAVNFYLAILVNLAMIVIMTRPSVLLTIGVIGGARIIEDGKEIIREAADIYAHALLYVSVFFLFAGIFSFRHNPGAIAMVVAALIVLFWVDRAGWFKTKYYRKVIYVFANGIILLGILSFIPRSGYIKVVGFYPYSFLSATALEDKVSVVEETERKAHERAAIKRLGAIEKKMKKGQALTAEEKSFWESQKQKRDDGKLLSRVSSVFHSEKVKASPAPMEIAKVNYRVYQPGEYTFSLKAGEMTDHWITFPDGRCTNYKFFRGENSEFVREYPDGSVFDMNAVIDRPLQKFKLRAVKDSSIKMVVG